MHILETKALNIFTRLVLYRRYIDDIFVLVKNETEANTLLNVINNIHRNITFEIEHPTKRNNLKSLNLLDFSIETFSES